MLAVGRFVPGRDPLALATLQYLVCALLCVAAALALEPMTWEGIWAARWPILYAGVFSTGLAYTGQILGQRHARPAHAAIILSMESVFAALSGWLMLDEQLAPRQLAGCGLILVAMLVAIRHTETH